MGARRCTAGELVTGRDLGKRIPVRGLQLDNQGRASGQRWERPTVFDKEFNMQYGIGGILILVLIILAIVFLARRV
jgi:hypothetical protein